MGFHPYLNFDGNCREAFTRYHEVFGGELNIMGMGDMPGYPEVDAATAKLVAHASLTLDGAFLMGSDAPPGQPIDAKGGSYVNFDTPDADVAHSVFAALADGGTVEMAIGETFWSPAFGICVDRFGTAWMVSAAPAQA